MLQLVQTSQLAPQYFLLAATHSSSALSRLASQARLAWLIDTSEQQTSASRASS
jgi:hypothetical protein